MYSSKLCFLKKLPPFSHWRNSERIMVFFLHWTKSQKPHLNKNARNLIAMYPTMCHSSSLVCQRVPPQHPHLLLQDLHHNILYLSASKHEENSATERSGTTSAESLRNQMHGSTKTENTKKIQDTKKNKAICHITCLANCKCSKKIWSMKVVLWNHGKSVRLKIGNLLILSRVSISMESRGKVGTDSGKHPKYRRERK